MLVAGSTTVREVKAVKGSMTSRPLPLHELARVRDAAAQRAGRGGERAREERARPRALTALEVAVAGAHGVLPARHHIAVHAEAHRAAGFAPLGAGLEEHAVEALGFRGALHLLRARHDQ